MTNATDSRSRLLNEPSSDVIYIATTACGEVNYILLRALLASLMKNPSASRIHLHLILDPIRYNSIQYQLPYLKNFLKDVIVMNVMDLKNQTHLMEKYETSRYNCAHLRLFYSEYFTMMDHILYLDTDTIVLGDLDEMWKYTENEMKDRIFGAALDQNVTVGRYLNKRKNHYYPPTGISTGIMLLNLKRMRMLNITGSYLQSQNDENVQYADQDIINTYAYYHPQEIFILPCWWNKRYHSNCLTQYSNYYLNESLGIIHGANHEFFNAKLTHGYNLWNKYENEYSVMTNSSIDLFANGTMLSYVGSIPVYFMDLGVRRWMRTINTLISLGLDLDQVQFVPPKIMDMIPEGPILYDKSGVNYLKYQ